MTDSKPCHFCHGDRWDFLGQLGRLLWFRCRYCGNEEARDVLEA